MLQIKSLCLHVIPRETWTWEEFCARTPPGSIALDGMVSGGPRFDETTRRANFDHHDAVVREATMSTCMQVFFAIKGGLFKYANPPVHAYLNDTDQDTALAVWLMIHRKLFEGAQTIPHINRLVMLTDRLDITGGAFPMSLDEELVRKHAWVFGAYSALRKSGGLASAGEAQLENNLEATLARLDRYLINAAGCDDLDIRHQILHRDPRFMIVDEIGGNEARYHLFAHGMDAGIALVARRPDGRFVYTIFRRSRYVPFPVRDLYDDFNRADGLHARDGWNGSDIVGGSSRAKGSGLSWEQLRDLVLHRLDG